VPPEEPDRFVEIPLSIVLAKRVKAFIPIAVKYLSVLAEGTVYQIDTAKFAQYREYSELLHMSKGTWCCIVGGGVHGILRIMDGVNAADSVDYVDVSGLVRRGLFSIELLRKDIHFDKWDDHSDVRPHVQQRLVNEEVARLESDPDAYQAEYDAARTQYETIRHLI
jgi:hypothetical protein